MRLIYHSYLCPSFTITQLNVIEMGVIDGVIDNVPNTADNGQKGGGRKEIRKVEHGDYKTWIKAYLI